MVVAENFVHTATRDRIILSTRQAAFYVFNRSGRVRPVNSVESWQSPWLDINVTQQCDGTCRK
jgi:hypothetical protein